MKCPACPEQTLVMADRSGIEIDYCPTCRGIWLDRGELDKLIERSVASTPMAAAPIPTAPPSMPGRPPSRDWDDDDHRHSGYDKYGKPYKKKKAKSLFEEIFDF